MVGKVYFVFLRFKENSGDAFNAKIKEPRVQTQFLLAGVEGFEPPDDGVRVRSLTAWRHPIASNDDYFIRFFVFYQAF